MESDWGNEERLQNAVRVFNKNARVYQEKFMDVSAFHPMLDFFCSALPGDAAEILELGCGPGNITHYLLDRRPGFRITGIDLAPNMIQLAQQNNPEADFLQMDVRNIRSLQRDFDAVVAGFCLPYLNSGELNALLGDIAKVLRPKGIFYLSTMEGDYSGSGFRKGSTGDELFIYYHSFESLATALKNSGFDILQTDRQPYTTDSGIEDTDLLLIARLK